MIKNCYSPLYHSENLIRKLRIRRRRECDVTTLLHMQFRWFIIWNIITIICEMEAASCFQNIQLVSASTALIHPSPFIIFENSCLPCDYHICLVLWEKQETRYYVYGNGILDSIKLAMRWWNLYIIFSLTGHFTSLRDKYLNDGQ